MEWSHCSVYKDMRIFTYSTSAFPDSDFIPGRSQWGATAAPALRVQLDGLTSSAGTLCGQTHCPTPSDEEEKGLHLAWIQIQPYPLLIYSLPWNVGTTLVAWTDQPWKADWGYPDSWSQWDSLVAIQHKQTEDSECRGEELGWERGQGVTAHRFCWCSCGRLHDPPWRKNVTQDCLCVCGTPHPAFTVMGELR